MYFSIKYNFQKKIKYFFISVLTHVLYKVFKLYQLAFEVSGLDVH